MAGKERRTEEQIERDRTKVAYLLDEGKSPRDIAAATGRRLQAIQLDIRALRKGSVQRTDEEIALDRVLVMRLLLKGWTQAEIAQQFKLSEATISRIVKSVEEEWKAAPIRDMTAIRAQLEATHRLVIAEAFEEFEKSSGRHVKTKVKKKAGGGDDADEPTTESEVQTEDVTGDPRYLKIVTDNLEAIAKLAGANAPVKVAPTNPEGTQPYDMGLDQFSSVIELARQYEQEQRAKRSDRTHASGT